VCPTGQEEFNFNGDVKCVAICGTQEARDAAGDCKVAWCKYDQTGIKGDFLRRGAGGSEWMVSNRMEGWYEGAGCFKHSDSTACTAASDCKWTGNQWGCSPKKGAYGVASVCEAKGDCCGFQKVRNATQLNAGNPGAGDWSTNNWLDSRWRNFKNDRRFEINENYSPKSSFKLQKCFINFSYKFLKIY